MSAGWHVATPRIRRRLFVGTVILCICVLFKPNERPVDLLSRIANGLDGRPIEARLTGEFDYRPFARHSGSDDRYPFLIAAGEAYEVWQRDHALDCARTAGSAFLLADRISDAEAVFRDALIRSTARADLLDAVHHANDQALLTDFSALLLTKNALATDPKALLIAFESADRACLLRPSPEALWNRALAIERLGFAALAARAWEHALSIDRDSGWSREANEHRIEVERQARSAAPTSEELFYQRELIAQVAAAVQENKVSTLTMQTLTREGEQRERVSGDHLASDTRRWLEGFPRTHADREQLLAALTSYAQGRTAFEEDRLDDALTAFRTAEADFGTLRSPLAWLARDQRIRCQCWHREPSCLESLRRLLADLKMERYSWLSARTSYAIGQTHFRQGRIYEAAEFFTAARSGLRRTNDQAGEALMDSLLANVLAMAGETDAALTHYLAALRRPSPPIGDRRRRQLGDFAAFLLRHGFISMTELVLDELDRWPATAEGRVKAATLRGIIAARRANPAGAARHLQEAHSLLTAINDQTVRADAGNALAVAEAGVRGSRAANMTDLDAAIARHEQFESSALLPQLLVERGVRLESRHEYRRAEADYLRAMEMLEVRGPRVDQMLVGFGFASEIESPFDHAIRLLLNTGRVAEALQIAERAMALRISRLYAPTVGLPDPFSHRSDELERAPLTAARSLLQPDQVIVVQHLLRDELVSWIVTASKLAVVRVPVAAPAMTDRIERFRRCAAQSGCRADEDLEYASNVLLRSWIENVPRGATLIISPPADLKSVPFSMLTTRVHEVLLERNPLVTTPGLRAYVRAMRNDSARRGAIRAFFAAAPRPGGSWEALPLAATEVTSAARSYPGAIVDLEATRTRFLQQASVSCVVHFAGHGAVNEAQPLLSALVFQPEDSQLLYIHEFEPWLFAKTRLMVLSACDTGVAPQPAMSIAHALLEQGIPSVVYTRWPVEDECAKEFAIEFHRAITAGESRAVAVQQAEWSLARKYPDRPDLWAAYEISGAPAPLTQ